MVSSGNSDFTEVDYVNLFAKAASGEEFDFLGRKGVCSDHPSVLCGSSEPKKVHMVWSASINDSAYRTLSSGDYYWCDSGPRILIYEKKGNQKKGNQKKGDVAIGFCHKYVLVDVDTEKETEWILKEYKAFGEQFEQLHSAIFEISFEPKVSPPKVSPPKVSPPKKSPPKKSSSPCCCFTCS